LPSARTGQAAFGGAGGKIERWLAVFGETGAPIQARQLTATLVAMRRLDILSSARESRRMTTEVCLND